MRKYLYRERCWQGGTISGTEQTAGDCTGLCSLDNRAIKSKGATLMERPIELAPQGIVLLSRTPDPPPEVTAWLTGREKPRAHLQGRLEDRDGEGLMCYIYHVGVLATEVKGRDLPSGVAQWLAHQTNNDLLILVAPPLLGPR